MDILICIIIFFVQIISILAIIILQIKQSINKSKINKIENLDIETYKETTVEVKKIEEQNKKISKCKKIFIWILVIGTVLFSLFFGVSIYNQAAKPIIYIYPNEETSVNVKLGNPEKLTCDYPKYNKDEGWNVIAKPNGDLTDVNTGRKLYALYWEGRNTEAKEVQNEGFVIEGKDTASFLEEKLSILGLNEREAEEFIVYWLPKMESNNYNYIRFESMEEINKNMPLEITPTPETLIRVLMEFKPLNDKIDVQEQQLTKQERKGYTVVEWGGTQLN